MVCNNLIEQSTLFTDSSLETMVCAVTNKQRDGVIRSRPLNTRFCHKNLVFFPSEAHTLLNPCITLKAVNNFGAFRMRRLVKLTTPSRNSSGISESRSPSLWNVKDQSRYYWTIPRTSALSRTVRWVLQYSNSLKRASWVDYTFSFELPGLNIPSY